MKKILFLIDKPNLYGSEQHVLKLMLALRNTFEVSLLAFDEGPLLTKLAANGFHTTVIPFKWYSVNKLFKLIGLIKDSGASILHAHQPKAMLWGSIASKLSSIPCIITVHSLPENNAQSYGNRLLQISVVIFHYFVKFVSELLAVRVIYLSKFSFAKAIFKRKSVSIPNWIDTLIADKLIKSSFGEPLQLVTIGSLTYNKGMDRLIEALALIKDHKWHIKIVGDSSGDYVKFLKALAAKRGILDRIEFVGYVNDVNSILLQSDGFILLSRGETFGLVYIEAMNCGLPVIAWDIPVTTEIIPPGNLIMRDSMDIRRIFSEIYDSQSTFRKLSLSNKEFVTAHFSVDKIYTRYRNLYDQVLSSSTH